MLKVFFKGALKRSILQLALFPLLACAVFGAAAAEPSAAAQSLPPPAEPLPRADQNGTDTQDAGPGLQLALKTISLSQGEGGAELWRLKAEWAGMSKEDGKIVVQRPILTYFTPGKDEQLLVTSGSGVIDQKEQILEFVDNVRIAQLESAVSGNMLVYNGTAATMAFPQGGSFTGAGVSGDASFLVWDINSKTIRAKGSVSVRFSVSETPALPASEQER